MSEDPKFRASYTLLQKWSSGNWQEAIEMYFRFGGFTSRAMAEGKDFHESWKKETLETGCLPEIFGGKELNNPIVEKPIIVELEPWLDLKIIPDCLEAPIVHEYKRSAASPDSFARTRQAGVYAVGCAIAGIYIDQAVYHVFDPSTKKVGTARVWLTDTLVDETHEWIITHSSEMHSYLLENELYKQFAGRRD